MDGRSSGGNPRAAPSHSFPAHTEQTCKPDDWVSASGEEGRQSREMVRLPGSQKLQRAAETLQDPTETLWNPTETRESPAETHQNPTETLWNLTETQQTPAETHKSPTDTLQNPTETRESPAETHQNPTETHQNPTETQKSHTETHQSLTETLYWLAETKQSPAQTHQNLTETNHSPAETHQNPAETHQSPAETHQSPTETHYRLAETEQSLVKTQQSPVEEPEQPGICKYTNHEDSGAEKQKPQDQIRPDLLKTALSVEQNMEDLSPTHEAEPAQKFLGDSFSTKQKTDTNQQHQMHKDLTNKTEEPPLPPFKSHDQGNYQNPAPDNIDVITPGKHQDCQKSSHLTIQQPSPPSADQQSSSSQVPSKALVNEAVILAPPSKGPPLSGELFTDQVQPCPPGSPSGEPKLCGFLLKQGGPLKAWKLRWFTYEDQKNQLFYYRTPQDVMPLGRIELCSATFTYPLKADTGTFHIKTPDRTFILKAVTQDLMLYWLQQLQVKRWQHREKSTCPRSSNSNSNMADNFLPLLKNPLGLVGEEAASVPLQRMPLANMSLKHPLIEIQNSVHSMRKRSSQEGSQSVFHVETPVDTSNISPPQTATEPLAPPPSISLAEPTGQESPVEGRESPSLFDSWSRKKTRSSSTWQVLGRNSPSSSSQRVSRLQQDKQMLMEEVKAQKELVWILHKALEASQLEKRTCAEFLAERDEQERLELLRHRERQASDLRGQLEELKAEAESLRMSLVQRDTQLAKLKEEVRMLTEKNNAKQQVIIKLSDQVTAWVASDQLAMSSNHSNAQHFRDLHQEIENLKDDIEAYKTQNKFLNSEIYQLTRLWRISSEQEKSLMMKCTYLEASNCQVESRYLGILRQLQDTKSLDPVQRGAVQKMVEEALKREIKSFVKLHVARDHDAYGFKIIPDYEVEDMKLLAKIQALEIRSHNLLHQEGVECPLLNRWAQYLAGRSDDDLCASPELKGLLRGSVPQEYRCRLWSWMVQARTKTIRDRYPQCYQKLCEKSQTSPHPASRQIELDLHRTLTTNQHFCSPSSPALQQLRRILLAFSWRNPSIGYCQGLNRLAAIALLVLQSEEDAFWCLVAVVETIMPQDYYTKNLVASQADQRVLKDFLLEKLPRLAAHFEAHSIDVSLITFNWFLVVFVECLPSDILLPLWDAFLYEGTKVIFRYTLALFKYKEDDILKIHNNVEIYQYLRIFTKTITDGRKLSSIAFSDMNPFPGRLLRNRRALHLERLQGELQELEKQQRAFVMEHVERKDKDLDTMMSEDDEEL